jgi:iron complex outermembrane receptor protein
MTQRFSFFCASAFLFFAGLQPFLFSQEIISVDITAEKFADEVPLRSSTSTVITAEEIAESGASSIVEILETVPGIMFRSSNGAPGAEEITMHGFGENAHGRVLVLVDGKRMNNPDMKTINWNAIALLDIERIEILDGSASVQYGNNAVAGVINIITKKSGKTQTSINLAGGSFWNNQEGISHQQSTDWGRLSVLAEHSGSEGYRDRSAYDTANVSLQGTVDFTDSISLSLNGNFSDMNYELPGDLTEAQYKDSPTAASEWADEAFERHISTGLELEWFVADNIDINIPLSYRGIFVENDIASHVDWEPSGPFQNGKFSNTNVHIAEAHPSARFNFEINKMPLNINLGTDFSYTYSNIKSYVDLQRNNLGDNLETDRINSAYYFLAQFQPLQTVSVNAGLRYDFAFIGDTNENIFHQAFVYEAGAAYKPFDFLNVYAKYSTLFRYPFFEDVVEIDGDVVKDLKPEQGYNIEGGINLYLDTWLSLNADLYYLQLKDEIAFDYVTEHNANIDETGRLGTNIGVIINPFSFLELQTAYSFVDAKFTSGINKNKMLPMVSAHEASGNVTIKMPLNINLGVDLDYRGDFYPGGDYSNAQKKIDGYFLLGASISYVLDKDDQHLQILFQGKNLLNTLYGNVYWGYSFGGYYPANGREFNLSVQYRF